HAWLWLPQVRLGRRPLAPLLLVAGLAWPALIVLSLAIRFGLGFDAPWYLLELVSLGYVHVPAVAITLAGAACAAQLFAVTAHRYAPYPDRGERAPSLVRLAGRILGVLLIVGGVLTLAWVVVVWRWQDAFNAIYTHIEQ